MTLSARSMEKGGLLEAAVRGLIHVLRADRRLDERAVAVLEAMRAGQPTEERIPRERFRHVVRNQSLALRLDEERAVAAIPQLLPVDEAACTAMFGRIRLVITAQGAPSEEAERRLARLATLFGAAEPAAALVHLREARQA